MSIFTYAINTTPIPNSAESCINTSDYLEMNTKK